MGKWYTLTEGSHQRWEDGDRVRYNVGDPIYLSDEEAEFHQRRVVGWSGPVPAGDVAQDGEVVDVEVVEAADADDSPPDDATSADDATDDSPPDDEADDATDDGGDDEVDWSFVQDESWKSVVSLIETLDDPSEVRAVLEAEEARGTSRPSIIRAASDRLEELGDD